MWVNIITGESIKPILYHMPYCKATWVSNDNGAIINNFN